MNPWLTVRLVLAAAIAVAGAAPCVAASAQEPAGQSKRAPVRPVPVKPVTPETTKQPATKLKLLDPLPEPGAIAESITDKKYGITDVWLENGVRVHHRFHDTPPGKILLSATLAGGQIEETAENAGITQAAGIAVSNTATSRLTARQFRMAAAAGTQDFGAEAFDAAFTIKAVAGVENLEATLQRFHAVLSDAKITAAALRSWKNKNLNLLRRYGDALHYRAVEKLTDMLTGGDPRRTYLTQERINAFTLSQTQAWWDRLCREAPIEFAIVGDIKLEQAMPLVQRYLGSLRKRNRTAEHLKELRRSRRPPGPYTAESTYKVKTAQSIVIVGFIGCEVWNVADTRAMQMAGIIVDGRLAKNLRDREALTTSIRTRSIPARDYEDSGRFRALARCKPEDAKTLADGIQAAFLKFGREGPSKKEMDAVLERLQTFHDLTIMGESYFSWFVLARQDLHRRYLKDEIEAIAAYKRITPDEIKAVFNKYNTPERRYTLIANPQPKEKPTPEGTAKAKPTAPAAKPGG